MPKRLIALARYLERAENHFRCRLEREREREKPIRPLVKFGENFQSFSRQNVCVSDLEKFEVQSNTFGIYLEDLPILVPNFRAALPALAVWK